MSSSRYQSRVLQTIAQQTMKVRDRALKSLRQLRLTLTWSAQILLYPIYVALQSSRLVGQQINQATQRIFPKLAAIIDPKSAALADPGQIPLLPDSDRPIQTIIPILVKNSKSKIQNLKSKIQNLKSPALANLLTTQTLVLVDCDNTIHDVLTFEQQQQLQQRIVVEVANYWRDRREYIAFQLKQSRTPRFLPIPEERPTMLPPVRYLRRFIAWMQTSPLAIATNLFEESAIVLVSQDHMTAGQPGNGLKPLPLDLWFDPDYHGSEDGWFNANQLNQVRRQREFPPVVPSLPARIGLMPLVTYPNLDVDATEMTSENWIQSAASNQITATDLTEAATFPESAVALFTDGDDSAANIASLEHYLAHHGVAYDFRRIENPEVNRDMLYPVPQSPQSQVTTSSSPHANAVDTTAELVAYEKHPLERLLGWVDQGMTWLETGITKVWSWLRDRV